MANQALLQKLVNSNLDFVVTEILPFIEKNYIRLFAAEVVERIKQTVVILTNDNPNNKEELNLLWSALSSDPEILAGLEAAFVEITLKVNDPQIAQLLNLLRKPLIKTLVAVTDGEKMDGEQIKLIWKELLESAELILFVLANLEWLLTKVIKDQNAVKWITKIINALIGK